MTIHILESGSTCKYNYRTWEYDTTEAKGDIEMTHEGRYLVFRKDWSPNTEYKYDLVTGAFIRIKHYKTKDSEEKVVTRKQIAPWLTKCNIITDSDKFALLYRYVKSIKNDSKSNPSWFIRDLARTQAQNLEQWLALGFEFREINRMLRRGDDRYSWPWYVTKSIIHAPNEYSKELMDWIQEEYNTKGELTFDFVNECYEYWNDHQYDVFLKIEEKIEQEPQYQPVFNGPINKYSDNRDILHDDLAKNLRNKIITTMQEYNLDLNAFMEYCLYLLNSEGIEMWKLMADYSDYLRREYVLQGEKMSKMNKYPKVWLTTTYKQQREFERLQRLKQLEEGGDNTKFNNSIEANKHLEWKHEEYLIRMPTGAEDIRDEASQMEHCVATYIPDIEAGRRTVMFMREIEHPERSLVTVEVINGAVTQAYARHDDDPTLKCKLWLTKWAMKKGLRITAATL